MPEMCSAMYGFGYRALLASPTGEWLGLLLNVPLCTYETGSIGHTKLGGQNFKKQIKAFT